MIESLPNIIDLIIIIKTMTNYYSDIVYLSDNIATKDENNFLSVVAATDIESHTLLLVEHVFTGTYDECQLIIRDNEYLFDIFHPRCLKWSEESEETKDSTALVKVVRNCYGKNIDNLFIGDFMAKFNHSCMPNAVFFRAIGKKYNELQTNYIAVISTKKIIAGEEITINYGTDRGHDPSEDFCCLCEKSKEERDKICAVIYGMVVWLQKKYIDEITKLVSEYEKKSNKIFVYQYLAKRGLIVSNQDIVSMKKSFADLLHSTYQEGTIEEKNNKFFIEVCNLFSFDE